jgi:hypothetical protein
MKILTYKQTHFGDPSMLAVWGQTGCMGRVRNPRRDGVIGVGGISYEPWSLGIDRRVTWIGAGGQARHKDAKGNDIVVFEKFRRFDAKGPLLADIAPALAKRIFDIGVRHLSVNYTPLEQREAEAVITWFLSGGRKPINGRQVRLPAGAVLATPDEGCPAHCIPLSAPRRSNRKCAPQGCLP